MAALDAHRKEGPVTYHDVRSHPSRLKEMLEANGGVREVPTIVADGQTTVGYGGT